MHRTDLRFGPPGPSITRLDIDAAKSSMQVAALPLDHERYLLRFNGARPTIVPPDSGSFQLVRVWWPRALSTFSTASTSSLTTSGRGKRACRRMQTATGGRDEGCRVARAQEISTDDPAQK
jgi:hypothetical protein